MFLFVYTATNDLDNNKKAFDLTTIIEENLVSQNSAKLVTVHGYWPARANNESMAVLDTHRKGRNDKPMSSQAMTSTGDRLRVRARYEMCHGMTA